MIATIAIGSPAAGLCATLLGSLRLANPVRFVPWVLDGSLADAEANGLLLAGVSEPAEGGLWPLFAPTILGPWTGPRWQQATSWSRIGRTTAARGPTA